MDKKLSASGEEVVSGPCWGSAVVIVCLLPC